MATPGSDYSPEEIQQAYHAAAGARDTGAMDELHGMLLKAYQKQTPSPTDNSDVDSTELKLAGIGRGMTRMVKGAGNLIGLGSVFPQTLSDEALKESDKLDQPLLKTSQGSTGNTIGQVVDTLPLGAATGAGLKAVQGGKVLVNALRAGTAGGENALQSAAMADPDEQGTEALKGAALGAGLSKVGQVAGRVVRGTVEKSEAAQRLIDEAKLHDQDLQIPISQGAASGGLSGAAKATYQHVLPYALGVESRLKGQSEKAKDVVRKTLTESGAPIVDNERVAMPEAQTQEQAADNLKNAYEKETQDKLKSYTFNTPDKFRDRVVQGIKDAHPDLPQTQVEQIANTVDGRMQEYSKDGTISGGNLLEAKAAAKDDLDHLLKQNKLRDPNANATGVRHFDDIIQDTIDEHKSMGGKQAGQVVQDLTNYQNLAKQAKEAEPVIAGSEKAVADRGNFSAKQALSDAAPDSHARRTLQDMHEVLEKQNPGSVNPAGRHILSTVGTGVGLPLAVAASGHPLIAAAGVGIPHLLANQSSQRFLYGDTNMQRALARAVRNSPEATYAAGLAARSAVNAP